MDNSHSRAGRRMMAGTLRIFIAEAMILPTGFVTAVFLARKLGPSDYGLFSLASQLMLWIEFTTVKMFSDTTIKFVSESTDWRPVGGTVTRLHIAIGLFFGTLFWLFAPFLADIFNEPGLSGILRLFSLEIPIFTIAYANRNILVGMGRFNERARISTIRLIARLVLIVLLVEAGLSIRGAVLGTIGASLLELLLTRYYVRPPLFRGIFFPIRPLLAIAVPAFMTALSLRIFKMDIFVLKALGGTASDAGFYGAATNLSIPLSLVSQSIASPLLSTLSHLIKNREESSARKIGQMIIRFVLWLIPFTVLASVASFEIVDFIFGKKFHPAAPILSALMFATLALLAINLSKSILMAINKPVWTFYLTAPIVPLAFIMHLIMIPIWGGMGAALVTAIVSTACAFFYLCAIYKAWKISPPLSSLIRAMISSSMVALLSMLWRTTGIIILLKLSILSLLIICSFFILKELTLKDLKAFKSMMTKQPD